MSKKETKCEISLSTRLNKYVDLVMIVVFIPVLISSIALTILPSGPGSGQMVWMGLNKQSWTGMHFLWGWIFIILMALHLVFHAKLVSCWLKWKK